MNLALERAEFFIQDFELQAGWYVREASVEVARRYLQGLDATLQLLRVQPGLGRTRHFRHPQLKGIRSFRVSPPFNRHLISDILAINWSQNSSQIAQLLSLQLNRYVFRAYL